MSKIRETLAQKPDFLFFLFFVLTIPWQTRFVFETDYTNVLGHFNEWLTFFVFLSDILLGLTLVIWAIRTAKNRKKRKNVPHETSRKSFTNLKKTEDHVPHGTLKWIFIILGLFTFFAILSVIVGQRSIFGYYGLLKLTEFILLFAYIVYNVNTDFKRYLAYLAIIFTGFWQALLAIGQFVLQRDLGLRIFGENTLAVNIDGLAKIVLNGQRYLRGYGTFSHPAVLSGFLIIVVWLSVWLIIKRPLKPGPKDDIFRVAMAVTAGLSSMALILTFSRTAWLAIVLSLLLFIIIYLTRIRNKAKPRTILWSRVFGFSRIIPWAIIVLTVIIALGLFWTPITQRTSLNEAYQDIAYTSRVWYNQKALQITRTHPWMGIGHNSFIFNLPRFAEGQELEWWRYQPVHNVYLLIASETGLLGLGFFLIFVFILIIYAWRILGHAVPNTRFQTAVWLSILFGFMVIMLADHYFWTLQGGALCLWLTLGMLASLGTARK